LALIARHIDQTDALIREAVGQIPSLLAKLELLKTLKGVKDVTAIALLA
jgi:hypothetical protein